MFSRDESEQFPSARLIATSIYTAGKEKRRGGGGAGGRGRGEKKIIANEATRITGFVRKNRAISLLCPAGCSFHRRGIVHNPRFESTHRVFFTTANCQTAFRTSGRRATMPSKRIKPPHVILSRAPANPFHISLINLANYSLVGLSSKGKK